MWHRMEPFDTIDRIRLKDAHTIEDVLELVRLHKRARAM